MAELAQLMVWSEKLYKQTHQHGMPNGLFALKGGNVQQEIKALPKGEYTEIYPIRDLFSETYFEEKFVVYVQGR